MRNSVPKKIVCLVCNVEQRQRADGKAYIHNNPAGDNCAGGGLYRYEMARVLRRFESRDNTAQVHQTVEVTDNAETILIASVLRINGHTVAEIVIDVPPADTARLIEQLTIIARQRELL